MATGENEKIERLRDRMLQCPICIDEYKDPRMLPCHHTVCLNCLLDYVKYVHASSSSGRLFRCPQCRADVCVPRGGVKDFPPNFYINCIQDELGSKPYFGICDVCEKDWLVSQYRCIDCDLDICRFCIHDHRLFGHESGRQSNIIRIETGNIGTHQTSERFCSLHKDEHLQMYCLTCDLLVCVSCVCDAHKKHDTITLGKKLQLARKHLQDELDKTQKEIKEVRISMVKLHEVEKLGDRTADDALKQIQDCLHEIVDQLQKMATDKSDQIQAMRGKYIKEIRDYETELSEYLDQLQRGSNFLNDLEEEDMSLELVKCYDRFKNILNSKEAKIVNKTIRQNTISFIPGSVVRRMGMIGIGRGSLQMRETTEIFMKKVAPLTKIQKFFQYSSRVLCFSFAIFVVVCLMTGYYQLYKLFLSEGSSTENILGAGCYTYLCMAGFFAFRKSMDSADTKDGEE